MGTKKFRVRSSFSAIKSVGFSAAAFLLAVVSIYLYSPVNNTEAAQINVSGNEGYDSIALSTNDVVDIDIVPTSEQAIYYSNNDLTVRNSCSYGATVSINTGSVSNTLTRVGSDSLTKDINPTTGSALINDSWGYSIDNGSTYHAVPNNSGTPAQIYSSNQATNDDVVHVRYGIKTDYNLPSGKYVNDIIYTVAVKPECLEYGVNWNLDGGTGAIGETYPTTLHYGDKINLAELTPTKENYVFTGWSNGSSTFDGSETNVNINPYNATTLNMTAQWQQAVFEFNYTGGTQTLLLPMDGYYKLEVWGAQGAQMGTGTPGYGAYSAGIYNGAKNSMLFIEVGGAGQRGDGSSSTIPGGYNGGGGYGILNSSTCTNNDTRLCGTGGGATHIGLKGGLLSNYASDYASNLLIAAGGGGGNWGGADGGNGGGVSGNNGSINNDGRDPVTYGAGGTQSAGGVGGTAQDLCEGSRIHGFTGYSGSFGEGGAGGYYHDNGSYTYTVSYPYYGTGGGGGFYGGGSSAASGHAVAQHAGAGGGSGYIGSSKLLSSSSFTKHMTCYSCSTSTADNTRTNSNTNVSDTATADYSKTGNGYARITYIGSSI